MTEPRWVREQRERLLAQLISEREETTPRRLARARTNDATRSQRP